MTETGALDKVSLWEKLSFYQGQLRGKLQRNADLNKLTWFRTGGPADFFFQPEDEEDLALFLQILPNEIPLTIVGIGSNLLVRDGGVRGVVIRLAGKFFTELNWLDDTSFCARAGISDKKIAMSALGQGVGGFHFYYGIPGTLGGALKMNAGANAIETSERVIRASLMDRKGKIHHLSCEELGYSYRHSKIGDDFIFLSAIMHGYKADKSQIQAEMQKVQDHRELNQPIREKTGGSTFRNPSTLSAWQAIEAAGCRGLCFGDAQMSEMHCNFMINKGEASAYELEQLGEMVRFKVYQHSKILLSWEIARIGAFEQGREVKSFCP